LRHQLNGFVAIYGFDEQKSTKKAILASWQMKTAWLSPRR